MPKVLVTGMGIVSAIGNNAESVRDSLIAGRSGIGNITHLDTVYKNEIPVGEIRLSNEELVILAGVNAGFYPRTALMGILAIKQALEQARLNRHSLADTALISGTTVGGMDRTELFFGTYLKSSSKGKIREISGHDCGDTAERIADVLGFEGFISTINTACSSSANSIMLATRMIQNGLVQRAVAGGVDCLTRFTLNGFNSLMILDRQPCRPFDENRNGLNLGEGSAFLVLESEEAVHLDHNTVLAEISGYGNACDAYHQTASSPEGLGAYLAMQQALQSAGLSESDIGYINAHGTGTKNNDLSEGIAIQRLFGSGVPPCSSTKAYTGHTLGAAGAIEAVISIIALREKCIFPNLNFTHRMQELSFTPVTGYRGGISLKHILSNSFGFGGNNSSLIISAN